MKKDQNKHGYRDSSFGWIPEDWKLFRLKDILIGMRLGGNYENSVDHGGIPVIKMGNLERGRINIEEIQYLPLGSTYSESDKLKEGDLLFNTRNTLELVGKVAIWRNELPLAVFNSNLLRLEFNKVVENNSFMNYVFNSHYGLKQLRSFAIGTTSVAAIYNRDLEKFICIIPSKVEQIKISSIIATIDDSISKTQQLITQLQQRNKGLMQQLLTCKTRLAGFTKEWQHVELNKCLNPISREVPKPADTFFALGIRSHGKGIFHKIDFDPEDIVMDVLYQVKENDLILNITFAWEQAIAIADKIDEGGLVSHRFPTFTFNYESADVSFFRYFILQKKFKYQLDLISPGGAGRNRVLNKKDFLKLQVFIPDVDEQIAIGKILDAAKDELSLTEQKLAALQQQKKGLMQKLLTGEIRVKTDNIK